jgi:AcrR family transcriptional regulator
VVRKAEAAAKVAPVEGGPSAQRRPRAGGGTAGSIWLRPQRKARDQVVLTRGRIVAEAVALLDEEGATRLTMRRLAERLQAGPTTLYWHVDGKDDVLDLALDAIFGEIPLPSEPGERWRDDVFTLIVDWRATILRHPWTAALLGRPMLGPNILARMEFLQATLVRFGLTGRSLTAATWALYNLVMGSAAAQATFPLLPPEQEVAQSHLLAQRELYPTLASHGFMLEEDWEQTFVEGLNYLLDGLEATG